MRRDTAITTIIPVLDEEEHLPGLLPVLVGEAAQVIVVDGGSRDASVTVARSVPGVEVVEAEPPRSLQLNVAAAHARGEVLFFLHADAHPPAGFVALITEALSPPDVVGGAFSLAIDDAGLAARIVAWGARARTRLTGHPYGDQGIFVRRSVFGQMQGFAALPVMEDLDFAYRLRRCGRVVLLPQRTRVSPRRWQAQGYARTTLRNTILAACFYLGIDPAPFSHWIGRQHSV